MTFLGVLLFLSFVRGDPLTQRHEILSQNTRESRLSYGDTAKSLSHLVLKRYRDTKTPGQTELP